MNRLAHRAEEALLGAAMLNPALLSTLRWIPPGAMSTPDNAALWQIMHRTDWSQVPNSEIPNTLVKAIAELPEIGLRQCLTSSRLAGLVRHCPTGQYPGLYGGMVLEAAVHRAVEQAGAALVLSAAEAEVDEADVTLEHGAETTARRLAALQAAWAAAPETVRNLLDTPPAEDITVAPRGERARTDLYAEATTVASLLTEPGQLPEVTGWLRPEDFSDPQMRAVYQAMETLADRHAPVDPLTVAWTAQHQPGPQISAQVMRELEDGGSHGIAAFHGEQVLATAALDRMHATGYELRNVARSPVLATTALLDRSTTAIEPLTADRERMHRAAGHDIEPAADKEPAPRPGHHSPEHAEPEMEMDL